MPAKRVPVLALDPPSSEFGLLRLALPIAALFALVGLPCHAMAQSREAIYEVESFRVPCEGVALRSCLKVRRVDRTEGATEEELATAGWSLFYADVEGFRYEPGYRYRLLVRETDLPQDELPADAPSTRFELLEVLEKRHDPRLRLNDIWMLDRLGGQAVTVPGSATRAGRPYLEFHIAGSRYLGSDGCVFIAGDLERVDDQTLRLAPAVEHAPTSVGPPEADAAPCEELEMQERFRDALGLVERWERDGLSLRLLDADGHELLVFRKTD